MTIETWIALITLLIAIGTIWLNLNLKIKEIEVKLNQVINDNHKLTDDISKKLDVIDNKLDQKIEVLTILKAEHDQIKAKCFRND